MTRPFHLARRRGATASAWRLAILVAVFLSSLWLSASVASALDVNVRNAPYNAVGDGRTNDRPAIQSAINAVTAAGGGTVTVPGTFTYLTGDLELKRGVTIDIQERAIIKQSTNTEHYAHRPGLGRLKARVIPWDEWSASNYPVIFAGNTSDVHVRGTGTIQLSWTGLDSTSIFQYGVGFSSVRDFSISEITISGEPAYNVAIKNSEDGEIHHITTTNPVSLNSDGISLMNCQDMTVHDNDLWTRDDAIYVWASYDDPRASAWWNSDTPRQSKNIEIYNNDVNITDRSSHGFVFINWTESAPDASQVEISNIWVHDNTLRGDYPLGALVNDPFAEHTDGYQTPSKNLRFERNTLISNKEPPTLNEGLATMSTSNLWSDDEDVYVFTQASLSEGIYNSQFDGGGNTWPSQFLTSFWSTEGTGTASRTAVGQPGGWYGQISGASYASIAQGVWLAAGRYTFSASVQSSGVRNRLFAIQRVTADTISVTGSTTFNNTRWEARSLTFEVRTAGVYLLGIDNEGSGSISTDFGRIDSTSIRRA
jgi:Glycosyl hydrolases family 28